MNERDGVRLRDMLDAAEATQEFIAGRTREQLDTDRMFAFALVRATEIVGEAATNVTPETRNKHSQIAWHRMIGMRHRIVHDYLNIDHDILWDAAKIDMPELIQQIQAILAEETFSDDEDIL